MKYCAVILARGGSRGIPGKNLIDLNGSPLIYWTILYAQLIPEITDIVVSSDSLEILTYSNKIGITEALLRPKSLANDHTTDIDTFVHIINTSNIVKKYDFIVHLRPTNPFRKLSWWESAIDLIAKNQDLTCIRSIELAQENPYKMWRLDQNNMIHNVILDSDVKDHHSAPRQILPKVYKQNAHLDIISQETLSNGSIIGTKPFGLLVDSGLPDIDNFDQLEYARQNFDTMIDPALHSKK